MMTLKELLDKKRAVVGRRLLVQSKDKQLKEITVKDVSESKEYVKVSTVARVWWQSVINFDKSNKIIEMLKG